MLDVDGLTIEGELNETARVRQALADLEGVRFFLGHTHENHSVLDWMLSAQAASNLVFAVSFLKGHHRHLMLLDIFLDSLDKTFCELAQQGWGGDRKLAMVDQESFQARSSLQGWHTRCIMEKRHRGTLSKQGLAQLMFRCFVL